MKIQILSDLHLETECFTPQVAPEADVLVLAGDVDSSWEGLGLFAHWPVPVIFVPGNHEFDGRELGEALVQLRQRCDALGIILLDQDSVVLPSPDGRRLRFLGTTRWTDFDVLGEAERPRAMRAAHYFVRIMRATRHGEVFDPVAVREEAMQTRQWLADALAATPPALEDGSPAWNDTVVITHFGPSIRSADPRYGRQPGTASFCNNDEDLMPGVPLWIHGHLHCRHDYVVSHADGRQTRVVSNARGHGHKGESEHFNARFVVQC